MDAEELERTADSLAAVIAELDASKATAEH
jgi:hypothetical protein